MQRGPAGDGRRAPGDPHGRAQRTGRGGALRYEEFVAAALDAQRTLTAQTLSNIFCECRSPSDNTTATCSNTACLIEVTVRKAVAPCAVPPYV